MSYLIPSGIDISDRQQAEQERAKALEREQEARKQVEAASWTKDEFLAIVSHELRSPLNAILGWARLLRSRKLDPFKIDKALETIERNAQAQTQLIEDLLDTAVFSVMRYSQNLPNLFLTVATTIFGVPHYCGNRYISRIIRANSENQSRKPASRAREQHLASSYR